MISPAQARAVDVVISVAVAHYLWKCSSLDRSEETGCRDLVVIFSHLTCNTEAGQTWQGNDNAKKRGTRQQGRVGKSLTFL